MTSAGFVSIEAAGASGTTDLSTFPQAGARVVLVSGEASDLLADPGSSPLASAFAAIEVPTVAGEVYPRASTASRLAARPSSPIRNDRSLTKSVSTVDDVDLVQGQVAVVLATAESGESKIGHYGYGTGADAALPSWSGP